MKLRADTWEQKCYAVSVLRVLAALTAFGGLLLIGLTLLNQPGGHDISVALWPGAVPFALGAGALLRRKVTAVLFSAMWAVLGGLSAFLLVVCPPPHPGLMLLPLSLAVLCFLPAVLTFRGWEVLN